MKWYLTKTIVFLAILVVFGRLVKLAVPYHWGNVWYSSKMRHITECGQTFDAYFIGSSRIYREVNPHIFDRIVNEKTSLEMKSFNLGAPATFCPQTYYLFEKLVDDRRLKKDLKYVFIELMEVENILGDLMHQERVTYWQNFNEYVFVLRWLVADKVMKLRQKGRYFVNYSICYLEGLFNLGHFGDVLLESDFYKKMYLGIGGNGYFPLDEEACVTEERRVREHLRNRRAEVLKEPAKLIRREERVREIVDSQDRFDVNQVHLGRIRELIGEANRSGIKLYFVLMPRYTKRGVYGLYKSIPRENRIDMLDPRRYPEFYEEEYSFDIGHLNSEGAVLLSRNLAEEFVASFRRLNEEEAYRSGDF